MTTKIAMLSKTQIHILNIFNHKRRALEEFFKMKLLIRHLPRKKLKMRQSLLQMILHQKNKLLHLRKPQLLPRQMKMRIPQILLQIQQFQTLNHPVRRLQKQKHSPPLKMLLKRQRIQKQLQQVIQSQLMRVYLRKQRVQKQSQCHLLNHKRHRIQIVLKKKR